MTYLLFIGYVVLCLLVGLMGRKTRIGFLGTFVASLLLTPFIVFIFLVVFERRDDPAANR